VAQNVNIHHEINYIEIAVTDLSEAKRFYRAAFDWEFNDYGTAYAGIRKKNGEGESGGLCLAEKVMTGGLLVVLYSNDLEQSAKQVAASGGSITKNIFSFPGGQRFHFCDPSGNELAVWSDKTP
jgi:predicted enzyme related to lactoylglutathione lyase